MIVADSARLKLRVALTNVGYSGSGLENELSSIVSVIESAKGGFLYTTIPLYGGRVGAGETIIDFHVKMTKVWTVE